MCCAKRRLPEWRRKDWSRRQDETRTRHDVHGRRRRLQGQHRSGPLQGRHRLRVALARELGYNAGARNTTPFGNALEQRSAEGAPSVEAGFLEFAGTRSRLLLGFELTGINR
jgi:hypothetical protein